MSAGQTYCLPITGQYKQTTLTLTCKFDPPISLIWIFLDCGKNPKCYEETCEYVGRNSTVKGRTWHQSDPPLLCLNLSFRDTCFVLEESGRINVWLRKCWHIAAAVIPLGRHVKLANQSYNKINRDDICFYFQETSASQNMWEPKLEWQVLSNKVIITVLISHIKSQAKECIVHF